MKNLKTIRKSSLLTKVLFVDGQAGCGKTMFTPIISSFNRLEIFKGDTVVWAVTTIPKLAPIDSLSLRFIYRADDSTYCYLFARWTDPDTIGNCIRAFSKTNDDSYFISMLEQGGNYNDEYVNGWSFSFPMYKGRGFWQKWGKDEDDSGSTTIGFWTVGDDVEFKWSSVDRASWDFWVSLEHNNPGGPFKFNIITRYCTTA